MPVNRRLIILAISALILAFLVNQAIEMAQEAMHLGTRAREAEQLAEAVRAMATATSAEMGAESLKPEEAPGEMRAVEEGWLSGGREPPIILNIALSLLAATAAAAAFLLIRHTKFNNVPEKRRVGIDQP